MPWPDASHLQAALLCLLVAGAMGWRAPSLLARLPEPEQPTAGDRSEAGSETGSDLGSETGSETGSGTGREAGPERGAARRGLPPPPTKEPYAEIARLPHLAAHLAAWSGLVAGAVGLALGWTGALLYLVPLVPVGVVLALVDWRTTLLPTRIIHPTYMLLALTIPAAALIDRDLDSLLRAGWGWLVVGGWFWVLWWLLNAWGFGDVRLARVLGPALGYLGWPHVVGGLLLMVLVGGLGGAVLGIANRDLRRRYPYGPFMLVGALAAVLGAPALAGGLGY